MIACIWVFLFFMRTPSPRPVTLKLILCLTAADFFFSAVNVMTVFDTSEGVLCSLEGLIRETSLIYSMFYASSIAILTYKSFVHGKNFNTEAYYKNSFRLITFIAVTFIAM